MSFYYSSTDANYAVQKTGDIRMLLLRRGDCCTDEGQQVGVCSRGAHRHGNGHQQQKREPGTGLDSGTHPGQSNVIVRSIRYHFKVKSDTHCMVIQLSLQCQSDIITRLVRYHYKVRQSVRYHYKVSWISLQGQSNIITRSFRYH